ncbi:MAG: amidophosphoribosyltransferase [Clostridia bacterium]|nr:amidophosphoribosyltransferase [Clostridia bacterium]
MFDKINEECGIFGIYSKDGADVVEETYLALYALQHRGQQSCGIAVNDDGVITYRKDSGLVPDVFDKNSLKSLGAGKMAIGHVRYATKEDNNAVSAQPLVSRYVKGNIALSYNGNLLNGYELREEFMKKGGIFQTSNDSETIMYTIAQERNKAGSVEEAINNSMKLLKGAYSFVLMSPKKLIAARDPHGFKPLCMGQLNDSYIFASESCALDTIGATLIRELDPGEIAIVDDKGIRYIRDNCGGKSNMCVFEHVYFARPDSVIEGNSVHMARREAGKYLAREHHVDADLVCGVPDSGLDAAMGYAAESGIPYGLAFIKNRYIGRTFIQPTQNARERAVKIKLNSLSSTVKGKRIVLVDDSIVRGTTVAQIIKLLRDAGAKEVHIRISSPPFLYPCYFGTDIDSRDKLIANNFTKDEICQQIGADSLGYLSIEALSKIAPNAKCDYCIGCFTGKYPVEVPDELEKDKFKDKITKK